MKPALTMLASLVLALGILAPDLPAEETQDDAGDDLSALAEQAVMNSLYYSPYLSATSSAEPRHLVITVPKSALNQIGGDEVDIEALRRAASVTQY